MGQDDVTEIAVAAVPRCMLCGAEGEVMYRDLTDDLYGAPGKWGFRRCPNDGLWWLDPRPLVDELPKVYRRYHTHAESDLRSSPLGRLWFALMPLFARAPFRSIRDIADAERMWLPRKPGRLLDVGAGDGEFVARMRQEGWDAHGVEPDAAAVERALERYGIALRVGTVDDVPDTERFDAITLDNVIEHVPDPVATLRRCAALLAAGGTLVVLTPNMDGLGHHHFGMRWRGLEPPRHLHLVGPLSLRAAAERAGLREFFIRTTPRALPFIWLQSANSRRALAALPSAALSELRRGGEELVLVASAGAYDGRSQLGSDRAWSPSTDHEDTLKRRLSVAVATWLRLRAILGRRRSNCPDRLRVQRHLSGVIGRHRHRPAASNTS